MRARIEYPLLLSQLWCMVSFIAEPKIWATILAALWFIPVLYHVWIEVREIREARHD